LFNFFSYRDPHSVKTLNTFDDSGKWLTENIGKIIDEQALFEAKLGVLQQLDAPISPQDKGKETFKLFVDHELYKNHREKVLNTSLDDIKIISERYFGSKQKAAVVGRAVIGPQNEELKQEKWIIN
jgi:presequence protease